MCNLFPLSNSLALFIIYPSVPGRKDIHLETKKMEPHEPSMVHYHMAHTMRVRLGLSQDHTMESTKEKTETIQANEKEEQHQQVTRTRTTFDNRE